MTRDFKPLLLASFSAIALSGCTGSGDRYPSLAIRDAERVSGQFTPTPSREPVAPVTDSASLAAIVDRARNSHQAFQRAVPGTRQAVTAARGLDADDNRWARAQVALADLTSHRSDTAIALADLDLLAADAATTFAPREEIETAQAEVARLIEEENRVLAELIGGNAS